ncbi:outer membrane protein assembly factor BamB [Congregibacter litoralis]|uniref:Outer membrane protein assembly factor BamB n=1 Tax=Congregibacter litoralis KT71 TaxID=314285 RepID=A4A463_9GAMM|nr:outer membrane protein assembly factor BamB [Congregibacter litoralis]EAQ99486.1 Beta-barrel assembly machine subunit BamB [Congregibacter litoralis KT71]
MDLLRKAALLTLLVTLAGCETVSGFFEMGDDEDPQQPAELQDIENQLNVRKLWSVGVGDGQGDGLYKLQPIIDGDTIYVASAEGEVRAVDRNNGDTIWRQRLDLDLSGGVGHYEDALFLGGNDGLVMRLDATTGETLWTSEVSGEVLAAPQSNGRVVVAQTYDGRLYGFDFETGEQQWRYDSNLPVLTIRGTSTPILDGGVVYAGFATGRVLAFDALDGTIRWEARVAIPQGRSEIERIVDVDGTMALAGTELYVASYQGRIAALDTRTGRKIWQRNVSAFYGVSQGFGNVYIAEESGTITAFLRNGQGIRWEQPALAWRGLSRPIPVSSYLAVVDFEGYLHLLSQVDGEFLARVRPDSDGARADMLAVGTVLYVYSNGGKLIAYDIRPRS